VIGKTHEYHQNAKRALFAFEEALLLPTALRIQTTSGMRESQNQLPVKHRPKAVHAVQMVLAIYVLVDLWLLARL
jgi:hypothetical protein